MTSTEINPAFVLRSYIWEMLKANLSWNVNDYDGLVPIVPVAEEPVLTNSSKPYIVYGYANESAGDRHFAGRGSMTMAVYSPNFRTLTQVMNVFQGVFDEMLIADSVNRYSSTIPAFDGLRFGFIETNFVEGGTPEETEGGRQSALVSLRYEYYVDYPVKTFQVISTDPTVYGWA